MKFLFLQTSQWDFNLFSVEKETRCFFYVRMQILFLLQDNAKYYFLRLESSIKLSAFHILNCDLKYKLEIFIFL